MSMAKKLSSKVNLGLALHYGVSSAIGAIVVLIGIFRWLYKITQGETDFSWSTLIGLIIAMVVLSAFAYSILRVAQEGSER
jgi:high-affinity Fe2+/Pb2+ permease